MGRAEGAVGRPLSPEELKQSASGTAEEEGGKGSGGDSGGGSVEEDSQMAALMELVGRAGLMLEVRRGSRGRCSTGGFFHGEVEGSP